uniref:Protein YIF1 n=1 Tax=Leptocylindrus danicus TaxID=163516 RepID=A0A7S2LHT7_9STRA
MSYYQNTGVSNRKQQQYGGTYGQQGTYGGANSHAQQGAAFYNNPSAASAPVPAAAPTTWQPTPAPHSGNQINLGGSTNTDSGNSMNSMNAAPNSGGGGAQPGPTVQQSQQPEQPQLWNPANINSMMKNDMVMNMAYDGGKAFLANGAARMIPGLELLMVTLRYYFAVDNSYVLHKMQRVLFPFLKKDWKRLEAEGHGNVKYALPRFDENAPDLYIPFMSLVTYVLLCALLFGSKGQFTPEALPEITTRCFVTQILEVLAIRLGHYVMQVPCSLLDMFCFTGYKYMGLCVNMLVGLFFGYWPYYGTMTWTASATAFFMLRTMANNVPRITATNGPKREVMVMVFAASQALTMWWLSQTKLLSE